MTRQPRYTVPGQPQHVIVRGNNREPIFCALEDYQFYLEKLTHACKSYDCDIHAYVLMTNHVHLLMTPHSEHSIGKAIQSLGRYYVQYFNYTYCRTGTLWEGRYKATLIDSEHYLLLCSRYIELNPARAGMVSHPAEYPWSSYHANAIGKENSCVTPHPLYQDLGPTYLDRQQAYRALFKSHIADKTLEEIRQCTNKGWVLGNDRFKEKIEAQLDRRAQPEPRGGDRKSRSFPQSKINRV